MWKSRDDGAGSLGLHDDGDVRVQARRPPADAAWRAGDGKKRLGTVEIVPVAGGQHQSERPSGCIGQRVELAGAAAARASDGVEASPPFAPAAERWTLMWVLSTEAVTPPITPVEPVSA